MPANIVFVGIGFLAGALAAFVVTTLASTSRPAERRPISSKLDGSWNLHELGAQRGGLRLVAERIEKVDVPAGSRVVLKGAEPTVLKNPPVPGVEVRLHPAVKGNFAIAGTTTLVFSSTVQPSALGLRTTDPDVYGRLEQDFERMWKEAGEAGAPKK
ncbi:MAG: hypothetical protein ACT4PT_09210 [Methanobacteriota archaeon]